MERVKLIASVSTIAILAMLGVKATAQQTNVQERTFLTFSTPVEMPGVVLEPGTYEFRLADTPQRNVVQVFRKDANDVVGQWTFVDSARQRVSEETVVMFRETAEGATPAVQYWYFPGERIGKEFIYPKDQAERIAARTGQQVRTDEGVVGGEQAQRAEADVEATRQPAAIDARAEAEVPADAERAEAEAQVTAERERADAARPAPTQPSAAAQPTAPAGSTTGSRGVTESADADASAASARAQADASVSTQPQVSPAERPQQANAQVAARQQTEDAARPVGTTGAAQDQREGEFRAAGELPRTASPLALSGLVGLLSLAGAVGLRRRYRS